MSGYRNGKAKGGVILLRMVRHPALRAGISYEIIHESCTVLRSESGAHWIQGSAYPLIIPLLDGTRTALETGTLLESKLAPEETHYALALLERDGFIAEPVPNLSPAQAAFWYSLGVEASLAAGRIANARVAIAGFDASDPMHTELWDALSSWGLHGGEDSGLCANYQLVIAGDYLALDLDLLNRQALESGQAWMLVNPHARVAAVGPLFRPGFTACWACLAHRLRENRMTLPWPGGGTPSGSASSLVLRLAADELAKWIALGGATMLDGSLLTFDHGSLAFVRHRVARRPQCPACGNPGAPPARGPVVLRSQLKASASDGGYRVCLPEQTLAALDRHVSPITGIIGTVDQVPLAGGGILWTTHLNGPLGSAYHTQGLEGRRLSAGGKGLGPAQSRVSCLAEAIERYSICAQGDESRMTASCLELGETAVDPHQLLQFSKAQYRGRRKWNERFGDEVWVPEPCDKRTPVDWVAAWSLTRHTPRWVPAALCYLDHVSDHDGQFFRSDSNGCAAGNTIEEAILQGFLELVERDAIAIWWYNRVRRPACDLATFEDHELLAAARTLSSLSSLTVLDITTDLGIPVFAALSVSADGESIHAGFGAHPDARLALRRAVSELEQTRLRPAASVSAHSQAQLVPLPDGLKSARDYPRPESTDLRDDVVSVMDAAHRVGLEVLVVDITRPEIGFPVVRVIVPGLRHHRHRFAPGRLYQVPSDLGWLVKKVPESGLNPAFVPL